MPQSMKNLGEAILFLPPRSKMTKQTNNTQKISLEQTESPNDYKGESISDFFVHLLAQV